MYAAVGTNGMVYYKPSLSSWGRIAQSGPVISVATLPNGTLLGVGADHVLYTRPSLTSPWQQWPGTGHVAAVTVLADGTILAAGLDRQLYTRATLAGPWQLVPNSGSVLDVTATPTGTIVGVGLDNQLYTRATLTSAWQLVPNSGAVTAVAAMPDGTLLGIDTGGVVVSRATLGSAWQKAPNSGGMRSIGVLKDGSLIAVGTDGLLNYATCLPSVWQPLAQSGEMIAIAGLRDGRVLGVGRDQVLYVRRTLFDNWERLPDTGAVKSIAVLPRGPIVGVGLDNQLYTRELLTGGWTHVPGSGDVTSIAALPDGSIVGVGTDQVLWRRATLTSGWQQIPGSGPIVTVGSAPDGTLFGVSATGAIARRASPTADWLHVPNYGPTVKAVTRLPDATAPAASDWLLQFTSPDPAAAAGGGRPWGDGTAMAARATNRQLPWDNGSVVTPMVGGQQAMAAIRDCFEAAIMEADARARDGRPPGQRGHVYIADWLLNALRDLSETNPWGGGPWRPGTTVAKDQTALGLVLRMMAAGINVRILLWMPTTNQRTQMKNQADEHWSIAAAIQDYNTTLQRAWGLTQPIGVVSLDLRTASPLTASLHQKAVVVRVGNVHVAFCGGVDLAFTRRDFGRPPTAPTGIGDWQSGDTSPLPGGGWPKQQPAPMGGYPAFPYIDDGRFPEDLPANVYGAGNRRWHDHHLKVEGPAVATLEQQFAERWVIDTNGRVYLFSRGSTIGYDNQVQLTSSAAFSGGRVTPLPPAQPVVPFGDAAVQMWRTIPMRYERRVAPFVRGEFTIMAGVANAVARATELITIWDQYFWSTPLARLLAARLRAVPGLRLLVVLPPYGTTDPANELKLRYNALQVLWQALDDGARARVFVADMWAAAQNVGLYVHAKVQTYDDALLVCGSANMNRRSFECDAELDCAAMHPPAVRAHLVSLHQTITGRGWSDFGAGWLGRFWSSIKGDHARALVPDPFFAGTVKSPVTPNGVPMPYDGWKPYGLFEPTSIGSAVDTAGACQYPECTGDPRSAGRLDEITFLLERCHSGSSFPWRYANQSVLGTAADVGADAVPVGATEEDVPEEIVAQIPRLTL